MKFFSSDHHFGHANVIKYSNRPFSSVEEMNQYMIDKWNSVVKTEDTVYHVGDFSFLNKEKSKEILSKLNGYIILIKGNHDSTETRMKEIGFKEVYNDLVIEIAGKKVLLCHFPFAPKEKPTEYDLKYMNLRPKNEGQWLIHGHVHQHWKVQFKMINVSVENWDYTPVSMDTMETLIKENPDGFGHAGKV